MVISLKFPKDVYLRERCNVFQLEEEKKNIFELEIFYKNVKAKRIFSFVFSHFQNVI